jgi:hypothetical protein
MSEGWIYKKDKSAEMFQSYMRALSNRELDALANYQVERMGDRETADDARERADLIRMERARRMR